METDISTSIVKPVNGKCNLSCSYCYMQGISESSRNIKTMNNEILHALVNFFCKDQNHIEFVWHGGEPLLAGVEFYQKLVTHQANWLKKGKNILNSVQTNATLLNDEWVSFFAENNFLVGVSLDGMPHLHNAVRTYPKGRETFQDVMKGIQLLSESELFTGIICCVSSANFAYPKQIFDFFISNGIKQIKFNRIKGKDKAGNPLPTSINSEQYADFLLAIFREWIKLDDVEVEIRELHSIINLMLGGNFRECIFTGNCHKYMTVYSDGSIYGCDSLLKEEKLKFGSVMNTLTEVQESPNFQYFLTATEKIRSRCVSCEWYNICRGGCMQDWQPSLSENSQNSSCESLKRIFSEIRKTLEKYGLI